VTALPGPAAKNLVHFRCRLIAPLTWPKCSCLGSPLSNSKETKTLKNIFVGNLDFGATEDTIRSLFEAYGTVERVSLMTDRDTGRSRGFAFVEMTDAEEADRAITALNGSNVGGRALNVNEARPKTSGGGGGRPGGGGGFRGGGGRDGGGPRQRREPRW
jgi:cold-inducible RNA-binding protein